MKNSTRSLGSHAHMPDVLRDWLKDYKVLRPSDLPAYAARIRKDDRLCDTIHSVIENSLPSGVASGHDYDAGGRGTASSTSLMTTTDSGLLSSLCHQLFQFYRQTSGDERTDEDNSSKSTKTTTHTFTFRRKRTLESKSVRK